MPSEQTIPGMPDTGDNIDASTFNQILEMDDDEDDREFSKEIVYGFFEQAEATFEKMDDALKTKDLPTLSSLGHFIKGSSATLGLTQMKKSCEKIQHWGHKLDEHGQEPLDADVCLDLIGPELLKLRNEFTTCERLLKKFFGEDS